MDEKIQDWLNRPYTPEMGTGVSVEDRMAKAAEYSAYQLYEINQKLNRLIADMACITPLVAALDK